MVHQHGQLITKIIMNKRIHDLDRDLTDYGVELCQFHFKNFQTKDCLFLLMLKRRIEIIQSDLKILVNNHNLHIAHSAAHQVSVESIGRSYYTDLAACDEMIVKLHNWLNIGGEDLGIKNNVSIEEFEHALYNEENKFRALKDRKKINPYSNDNRNEITKQIDELEIRINQLHLNKLQIAFYRKLYGNNLENFK